MNKKLLILDLDGTLYQLNGASYNNSPLKPAILARAKAFIGNKLNKDEFGAEEILNHVQNTFKEGVSIGLEKSYGLDRYEYFNFVWDLEPSSFIVRVGDVKQTLERLATEFKLVLVSDAPKIWVTRVLKELDLVQIFGNNVYTGEGDIRKDHGNRFQFICEKYETEFKNTISVGDQESTDIIPPKALGVTTVYVGSEKSNYADHSIDDILQLPNVLNSRNYLEVLAQYLGESVADKKIKNLGGTSDSKTVSVDGQILKIGLSGEINKELANYQKYQQALDNYNDYFPQVELVYSQEGQSILKIENLGNDNFEQNLRLSQVEDELKLVKSNERILLNLRQIYNETKNPDKDKAELFFTELIQALKINLHKAGLWSELEGKYKRILENKHLYLNNLTSGLAHKDLSAANIIIRQDKAYFIDPRPAFPYLGSSEALGNVAIDLAGLQVSAFRKNLELKKNNSLVSLQSLVERIEKELDYYIKQQKAFSKSFWHLCQIVWYSVYSACKCEYCTSAERCWLYDEMVIKLKKLISE